MKERRKLKIVNKIRKAPFFAILFFIFLGLAGISLGEPQTVLERALQVCLSCIGIG